MPELFLEVGIQEIILTLVGNFNKNYRTNIFTLNMNSLRGFGNTGARVVSGGMLLKNLI